MANDSPAAAVILLVPDGESVESLVNHCGIVLALEEVLVLRIDI